MSLKNLLTNLYKKASVIRTSLIRTFLNSNNLFCPLKKKTFLIRILRYTSALFQYYFCGVTIEIRFHALPVQIELGYFLLMKRKNDIEVKEEPPACPASFEVDKAVTTLQQFILFCDNGVELRKMVEKSTCW